MLANYSQAFFVGSLPRLLRVVLRGSLFARPPSFYLGVWLRHHFAALVLSTCKAAG